MPARQLLRGFSRARIRFRQILSSSYGEKTDLLAELNPRRDSNERTLLACLGYLASDPANQSVSIPDREIRNEFLRQLIWGVKAAYYAAHEHWLRIRELPGGNGSVDLAFLPKKNGNCPG